MPIFLCHPRTGWIVLRIRVELCVKGRCPAKHGELYKCLAKFLCCIVNADRSLVFCVRVFLFWKLALAFLWQPFTLEAPNRFQWGFCLQWNPCIKQGAFSKSVRRPVELQVWDTLCSLRKPVDSSLLWEEADGILMAAVKRRRQMGHGEAKHSRSAGVTVSEWSRTYPEQNLSLLGFRVGRNSSRASGLSENKEDWGLLNRKLAVVNKSNSRRRQSQDAVSVLF